MNLKSNAFILSGCGYLKNIILEQDKFIARIDVINNHTDQDDVLIDCELEGSHHEVFFDLLGKVKQGNIVIVTFKAEYQRFLAAYSHLHSSSSKHMVMMHLKRCELGDCYVNGCLVKHPDMTQYKVAA